VAARKKKAAADLERIIEDAAKGDWRAAAWLIRYRKDDKPATGRDGVDELARKRSARRKTG